MGDGGRDAANLTATQHVMPSIRWDDPPSGLSSSTSCCACRLEAADDVRHHRLPIRRQAQTGCASCRSSSFWWRCSLTLLADLALPEGRKGWLAAVGAVDGIVSGFSLFYVNSLNTCAELSTG